MWWRQKRLIDFLWLNLVLSFNYNKTWIVAPCGPNSIYISLFSSFFPLPTSPSFFPMYYCSNSFVTNVSSSPCSKCFSQREEQAMILTCYNIVKKLMSWNICQQTFFGTSWKTVWSIKILEKCIFQYPKIRLTSKIGLREPWKRDTKVLFIEKINELEFLLGYFWHQLKNSLKYQNTVKVFFTK